MKYIKQKMKYLPIIYFVIVIITMFFMLFIFPLMFDEYREYNISTIIIVSSVLLLSIEGLIKRILAPPSPPEGWDVRERDNFTDFE